MTDRLLTDEAMKERLTLYERLCLEYPNRSLGDLCRNDVITIPQLIELCLYLMEEEE